MVKSFFLITNVGFYLFKVIKAQNVNKEKQSGLLMSCSTVEPVYNGPVSYHHSGRSHFIYLFIYIYIYIYIYLFIYLFIQNYIPRSLIKIWLEVWGRIHEILPKMYLKI